MMMLRPHARIIRLCWPPHPKYGQTLEVICWPVNGMRQVRFESGEVGVLEAHEWEVAG